MKHSNLIIAILIISFILIGCGSKTQNTNNDPEIISIETTPVKVMKIERTLDFSGTIMAWREANLGAQTPGRIEKIYVKEGDEVKEGDLLVQMDDAQLTQARIQYEISRQDYERMKPLFDEGSISQQQFDKVKAGYETAKSAYELILRNTQLRAPFSGIVTAKRMNEGEVFILAPSAQGAPSIINLMQIDFLKVLVNVPESDFPQVRLNQSAKIEVDIYPEKVFTGTVSRVDPAINPVTRTFTVEIKIPNSNKILRPGMFARVKIKTGEVEAIFVPRSALIKQLGSNIFYVYIAENNTAKRRDVNLGLELNEWVEIKSGLNPEDQLIIKGLGRLKNGSPVKIVSSN
ncbi:MAG: putative Co/Zn/Cd efflux system membrane fusion protein [Ignavibacteriae bacterium]|nr:MAG: putative Co/Zn/Cd efflux system membrane fusion protein [Ignavibacteriota bacterium]